MRPWFLSLSFVLVLSVVLVSPALPGATEKTVAGSPGAGVQKSTSRKAKTGRKDKKKEQEDSEKEEEKWRVSAPPGEWKTVVIDTTETTWSNVDVSADGSTVLFDMLGDLYTVPMDGGEAEPLTHGIEWDFQPRYSPDGSQIAFISDRDGGDNLWVMNADGSQPRAITQESEHLVHNPYWSPDGQYLLAKKGFTSTRSIPAGEIWLFHVGGGGGLAVAERPNGQRDQKNMAEPAFSPDGRYVYYSQDMTSGRVWQYNKDSTGQIFVIRRLDRDKGKTETFVSGPGGAVRPTPSPDGKYLAFIRRLPGLTSALYLKDLESGTEWPIHDRFERDHQESSGSQGNAPAIAWTRDSSRIVFWSEGHLNRIDVKTRRSQVLPVHVRVEKKVQPALRFPVAVAPETFRVKMPRWAQRSPSGETVVFQALGHLYARDRQSDEPRRLTAQDTHFELYPSFSRDGRWIVYTTWSDQDLGSVRIVSVDGGEGRVLTREPGHYVEPCFSPSGEEVVYRKITGGALLSPFWSMAPGIYRVPADGAGAPERVTDSGERPHFGSREDRVFFSTRVDETELALKSVNLDGLDPRTHVQAAEGTELSVSPDGRWVAFTQDFNAYVAPLPRTGKKVTLSPKTKAFPVKQVSRRSGEFLHWSADAGKLHWAHGATLYDRELKDAFAFLEGAPDELPEPVEEGVDLSFETASDVPAGRIALVGGRIVTMRGAMDGTEEVIENGTVLIRGNRIEAVGERDAVTVSPGTHTVNVEGHTIIPGLIDVHAHGAMARNEITPQQNWQQYANLAFGVTTIHDPSNDTSSVFAAAELQRAGRIVAPRIFSTGTILYGAHMPGSTAKVSSLEDARFHLRRMKDVGAISVKSYQQPRRDQRQQIVAAGRELGVMVVPEGGMKFQHNMNEIVDGHTGIEHSLPVKTAYDDVLQLWSQTDVGYTPTFVVAYGGLSGELYWYEHTNVWKNERLMTFTPRFVVEPRAIRRPKAPEDHYNHFFVAATAKELMERGVSVQIGAHGQRAGLAAHWEMWMMEQGGFSPWQALRGATLGGAWYVGLDGDLGSLEEGKLADLVVIAGNPLEDLRRSQDIAYTMLNGRLYDASTMNQVAPDPVSRKEFFFEKEGGDTIHPATQAWLAEFERLHGCRH